MAYLTPDSIPGNTTCRVLLIPDSTDWLAIVTGAIQELSFTYNWEQFGTATPQECADAMFAMLNEFTFNRAGCRMIGEIIPFAGASSPIPALWLPCDGQALSKTEYPDLFAVIGTVYGEPDSTHFSLPDLRGRTLIHSDTTYPLGTYLGETEHVLTVEELAQHSHYDNGHSHQTGNSFTGLALAPGEEPVLIPNPIPAYTGTSYADIAVTGIDAPHNNMQPSVAINYFIVAKDRA